MSSQAKYSVRVDVSGGYVGLHLDVNLSQLDDRDRELVTNMLMSMLERAKEQAIRNHDKTKTRVVAAVIENASTQFDGEVCDPECRDPQSKCSCDPLDNDGGDRG